MIALPAFLCITVGKAQIIDEEFDRPALQRVQAARVAYITDRLGFTPGESEKFWSLQNQFEIEQEKIRQKYEPKRPVESMSDSEAGQFIEGRFKMEKELLDLKESYYQRFNQVVSPKKIVMFHLAEKEFRRIMLQRIQERNLANPRRRPGFQRN